MIDQKDRDALLKLAVFTVLLMGASFLLAIILGISLHVFRALAGV